MPLHELVESDRVVGAKSVLRRLLRSEIKKIFFARDAERKVIEPILKEAEIRKYPWNGLIIPRYWEGLVSLKDQRL